MDAKEFMEKWKGVDKKLDDLVEIDPEGDEFPEGTDDIMAMVMLLKKMFLIAEYFEVPFDKLDTSKIKAV